MRGLEGNQVREEEGTAGVDRVAMIERVGSLLLNYRRDLDAVRVGRDAGGGRSKSRLPERAKGNVPRNLSLFSRAELPVYEIH